MRITIGGDYVEVKEITIEKTPDTLLIDIPRKVSNVDLLKVLKLIIIHIVK